MIADVQASDALLLGRTTYDIFRAYWPGKTDEIGRAFDRVPKYVASRRTPELSWEASTQITDVGAQVRDLRERHEQIHTWGSANLLQTLFRAALVDQLNLWVCPVVIGQRKQLFPEAQRPPGSRRSSRRRRTPAARCCCATGASKVRQRRSWRPSAPSEHVPGEGEVDDAARGGHRLDVVVVLDGLQSVPDADAAAEHDRDLDEV